MLASLYLSQLVPLEDEVIAYTGEGVQQTSRDPRNVPDVLQFIDRNYLISLAATSGAKVSCLRTIHNAWLRKM